jgi:hypothetical protein
MNLDDVIPNPQYRMCHSRNVAAPPTVVWDELLRVPMSALPLARALEGLRLLPARLAGRNRQPLAGRTFLDVTPIPVLFAERPHVVIAAGLSQAWRLLGGATPPQLEVDALRAWSQPGWIKVAMEFRLESTPSGTLLRTETRMLATDPQTRWAFAAYWFLIRSSSGAIRREVLRVVADRAESLLRDADPFATTRPPGRAARWTLACLPLRRRRATLATMGMEAFADRARRELLATGATARKRTVETHDQLTAPEALIARLARDGLSNPRAR